MKIENQNIKLKDIIKEMNNDVLPKKGGGMIDRNNFI